MKVPEVIFTIDSRRYRIAVDFNILLQIEAELGSLNTALERLKTGDWTLTELVQMLHIMISTVDDQLDFSVLGQKIVNAGAGHFIAPLTRFLTLPLSDHSSKT
jgi:hypothetical protein